MGIKDWFRIFGGSALSARDRDLSGKCVGVDASCEIYRASLGMSHINGLTDTHGSPTILLNVLLCNICKYKKLGLRGLIYIFDHPSPNPLKAAEKKRRRAIRVGAAAKYAGSTDEKKKKLEKRMMVIDASMISDVKTLLTYLGVAFIQAPCGYEAEHLGAELSRDGTIDTFITSDSDSLMFGCTSMTRRIKRGQYEEYKLDVILAKFQLTQEQFVRLGVVLGCDFAEKTRGVGPKTIFKRGPQVLLSADQQLAESYFLSRCPYDRDQIQKTERDILGAITWLCSKNFNRQRIEKLLSVFA